MRDRRRTQAEIAERVLDDLAARAVEVHPARVRAFPVIPEPLPPHDDGVERASWFVATVALRLARREPRLVHVRLPVNQRAVHVEQDRLRRLAHRDGASPYNPYARSGSNS